MSADMSENKPDETPAATMATVTSLSRRGVVRNTAAAGVGAASVLAFGPGAASAAPQHTAAVPAAVAARRDDDADDLAGHDLVERPLVVHVRDADAGLMDVFHGERHHEVRDPALAAAILRHLR